MLPRTLLALSAWLSLATSASAASETAIINFEAELAADPLLLVEGRIEGADAHWLADYAAPQVATDVLNAERALLVLVERRTLLQVYVAPPQLTTSHGVGRPETSHRILENLQVTVATTTNGTRWYLAGGPDARLEGLGRCAYQPVHGADDATLHALGDSPRFRTALVEATCSADSVRFEGPFRWSIWNTTLLLRHRASSSDWTTDFLRTGEWVEPSTTVPGAYDHVQRRAILSSVSQRMEAQWPAATARVYAERLAATGILSTQRGETRLVWQHHRLDAMPRSPAPEGVFMVSAQNESMMVEGATSNAPSPERLAKPLVRLVLGIGASTLLLGLAIAAYGLYARLRPTDVTRHPARARILAHLKDCPGRRVSEIQAATGIRRSSVVHHVQALVRAGLVRARRVGSFDLFALAADADRLSDPGFLAFRLRRRELLLQILQEEPGLRQEEIAQRMGITQSYVSRLLARLREEGLVQKSRAGGRSVFRPASRRPA